MAVGSLVCAQGVGEEEALWGVSRKRISDSKSNEHTQHSQVLPRTLLPSTIPLLHSLDSLPPSLESALHFKQGIDLAGGSQS